MFIYKLRWRIVRSIFVEHERKNGLNISFPWIPDTNQDVALTCNIKISETDSWSIYKKTCFKVHIPK